MTNFKYNPGDRIGPNKILFLERLYKKPPRIWYGKFQCPYDGIVFTARINDITSGRTKSCGCLHSKTSRKNGAKAKEKLQHHLEGKIFGNLTVLREATEEERPNVKRKGTFWLCYCSCCGKKKIISQDGLENKNVISCGCVFSKGEQKILDILQDINIPFITQKTFNDCINPDTNKKLRFDFYLPDYNCCIEYDGEQHFKYSNTGWNIKEQYEKTKYLDSIKQKYCEQNNIFLVRIPYTEYDKIDTNYIIKCISDGKGK